MLTPESAPGCTCPQGVCLYRSGQEPGQCRLRQAEAAFNAAYAVGLDEAALRSAFEAGFSSGHTHGIFGSSNLNERRESAYRTFLERRPRPALCPQCGHGAHIPTMCGALGPKGNCNCSFDSSRLAGGVPYKVTGTTTPEIEK